MSKYRINVRFDLDKPKEANAAQYLQSLDKSRNAFMVTAPPVFEQVQPELTEEQQAENEKSVLDDLEMFG